MIRIAIAAGGVIFILFLILVFQYPLWLSGISGVTFLFAFLASYRAKQGSPSMTLVTVTLFFSLLILLVFGTRSEWTQEHMVLFISLLMASAFFGSLEILLFQGRKQFPAFTLLFLLFFWLPIVFVVFMLLKNRFGLEGGLAITAVLLAIVIRDLFRRKKEYDSFEP